MVMWVWLLGLGDARPPVAAEMHERFEQLTKARNAVIEGDLEKAKQAGSDLAAVEPARRLPRGWRKPFAQFDQKAEQISQATNLVEAATAVSRTATACGECHQAVRGGPSLEGLREIPAQAWDEGMNMPLHKWSVDWMWLGLLAPDDEAWQRGAQELDRMPLTLKFEGAPPPGSRPQLEQLVYILADRALKIERPERPVVMGQLLATCAECHVQNP